MHLIFKYKWYTSCATAPPSCFKPPGLALQYYILFNILIICFIFISWSCKAIWNKHNLIVHWLQHLLFFTLVQIILYHVCIVALTRGFHITHVLVLFVLWHYGYWNHPRHHWPYYRYRLRILFPITIQNNYFYYYYLPTYK